MKYIIVKGWLGFGDRLQSLKMCVKFAIENNRAIYVDWTDSTWSHGSETFYTYFNLVNMPTIKSISEIPEDAEVFPPFWKGKLNTALTYDILNNTSNNVIVGDNGYLNADVYPDVLVYSCVANRYIYEDSSFFANVFRMVDKTIYDKVKYRQSAYNLSRKIAIHLRGTDRTTRINKSHRMSGINVRMVSAGLMGGAQFVAVSDDSDFSRIWKARFSQFPLITEISNIGWNVGVHDKPKTELTVSKHELNVDMLSDFFTISSCLYVISTANDSRFAQEAMRLHKHVSQIIGI